MLLNGAAKTRNSPPALSARNRHLSCPVGYAGGWACEHEWARNEVLLFLKNWQRSISLHNMYDF